RGLRATADSPRARDDRHQQRTRARSYRPGSPLEPVTRGFDLTPEFTWILRHSHRLGVEDVIDGRSAYAFVGGEAFERVSSDSGDSDATSLRLSRHLSVARIIQQDLHPMVQHAHTVAHA